MADLSGGDLFRDVDALQDLNEAASYLALAAELASKARHESYELLDLREGSTVLDVGCGLGEVCADLVDVVGSGGGVCGIDASRSLIGRARERWRKLPIRFDVGDAETLAFNDATFDAVYAERVVQHLDRPALAIAEMARVLRPGGRVLILDVVHDAAVFATEHQHVSEVIRRHGLEVPRPNAGLYLHEWMQSAGLEVTVMPGGAVLDNWDAVRTMLRVDAGAEIAAKAGLISATEAEAFLTEQQERSRRGVFAVSTFFVRALGTKPS